MFKLNKRQRTLVAITDLNKYDIFICQLHNIYSIAKVFDNKTCPYCKKQAPNITKDLIAFQEEYRKEIGL